MPASLKEVSEAVERWNRSQKDVDDIQKEREQKKAARDTAVASLQAVQARLDLALAEQLQARVALASVLNQP